MKCPVVVFAVCCLHLINSQCTRDQLTRDVVEKLTSRSLAPISQSSTDELTVQEFNIVCLSIGTLPDNFRTTSVVVQYNCAGSFCPQGELPSEQLKGCFVSL